MRRRTKDRLEVVGVFGLIGLGVLAVAVVAVQMFKAADRGDMPHVVAWGVALLVLARVDVGGRWKS